MLQQKPDGEIVRAVVFRGIDEPLSVEDIVLDAPSSTEVLVRMKAVGLCHTEQHVFNGELPTGRIPLVPGHEGAGIVEAVGSEVQGIKVGDHVALLWKPLCKTCQFCKEGKHHRCLSGDNKKEGQQFDGTYRRRDVNRAPVGSLRMTGAFAEKTVVDQASVVVVDQDLPFEVVALVSCGALGGYGAVMNATTVHPGDAVLVVGSGGQGSVAMQAARLAGAAQIIAADLHQDKLDQAPAMGATDTILVTAEGQLAGAVMGITDGQGVDHAIICAGSVDALVQSYRATKVGGSVVLSGIPPVTAKEIPLFPLEILGGNGKTLVGSQYGSISPIVGIPQVLEQYRRGRLQIGELVSRRYSLDDVARGYKDLAAGLHGRGLVCFD